MKNLTVSKENLKDIVIEESLGKIVEIPAVNQIGERPKESWELKFENYLAEKENSLKPLVNDDIKPKNDEEGDEKIKADSKKVAKEVVNTQENQYDYSPSVENINNQNAQEVLNGIQCEINYNKDITLDEAKEIAVKNLAKDPLYYVKEGQFGVKGLGYQEQKVEESDGNTYGGSGYSDKVKVVKENKESEIDSIINEHLGGVVTSGNPTSFASMAGEVIKTMMAEKEEKDLPMDEDVEEARDLAIQNSQEAAGIQEKKQDHDGDGDIDSDDYLAARDKAIKKAMGKKPKKESIETKLAEIGKQGEIVKLEAQINYLDEIIEEKSSRLNSINEDDNLKELVDRKKMKMMQKEVKILEKRKAKMEKMYEKMSGKSYKKVVDEGQPQDSFDFANPTGGPTLDPIPRKVGQGTGKSYINRPSGPAKFPN
tara:strand:- start:394 stop:1671 length:1278 start_codon:yes stop_codon:yes gene_type:complete